MTFPKISPRRTLLVLLALYSILLFYQLGSWGVLETSEARYADMGREMYLSGDYLHPTFTGLRHYHKPPLTYAITAYAYRLFGVSPWSARLFLQLALLLQLLIIYRIGRLLFEYERTALWATVIYASFPALLIASRNLTTDLYLTTFLLAGVWAFLRSELRGPKVIFLLLAYAFWGLAALTKGAGVVILPAVLLPSWYLLYRPVRWVPVIGRHVLGVVVFCVIGLSWYIALIAEDRSLIDYFVIEQTIKRYTTDQWMRAQPAWFYLATVTATTFPWLLALLIHGRKWKTLGEQKTLVLWLVAWIVGPILFYSFAQSKLILYVLPAYAGIALLGAIWLERVSSTELRIWTGLAQALFLVLLIAMLIVTWASDTASITPISITPVFVVAGCWAVAVICFLPPITRTRLENRPEDLLITCLVFTIALLPMGTDFLARNELLVNSPQPLVHRLERRGLAGHDVYMLNRDLPGLAFGLGVPIVRLYEGEMPRDTSREINGKWQERWYDISRPDVRARLAERWLDRPSVVVAAGEPSPEMRAWLGVLEQTDTVGRYLIYYNYPKGPAE